MGFTHARTGAGQSLSSFAKHNCLGVQEPKISHVHLCRQVRKCEEIVTASLWPASSACCPALVGRGSTSPPGMLNTPPINHSPDLICTDMNDMSRPNQSALKNSRILMEPLHAGLFSSPYARNSPAPQQPLCDRPRRSRRLLCRAGGCAPYRISSST